MSKGREIKKQKTIHTVYDEKQTISTNGVPSNPTCIFCKIVAGNTPSFKLYEDDNILAFLDINPLHKGHTLVIPKAHYERLDKLPGDLAASCMSIVPMLSRALMKVTNTEDWNIMQNNGKIAGQEVFHVHFHLIPRSKGDYMSKSWCRWNIDKLEQHNPSNLQKDIQEAMKSEKNGKEEE